MAGVAFKSERWLPSSVKRKLAVHEAESRFEPTKHTFYEYERVSPKCVRLRELAKPAAGSVGNESNSATLEYVQTVKKLIELLELPGGWNSYNAKPITKENVQFAVSLLARVMHENTPVPHVIPKVRGGVRLEWHRQGMDIEIDIDSPERASFFADDLQSTEEPVEQALDEIVLGKWISRLSG